MPLGGTRQVWGPWKPVMKQCGDGTGLEAWKQPSCQGCSQDGDRTVKGCPPVFSLLFLGI